MTNHTASPNHQITLSTEDAALIQHDVGAIDDAGDQFAVDFYDNVFAAAPGARAMFPDDLTAQRRKLMSELSMLIGFALDLARDNTERFIERAEALGQRHVSYGVAEAHYGVVGDALIDTLAEHVPSWNGANRGAWTRLYTVVAQAMQRGAARDETHGGRRGVATV